MVTSSDRFKSYAYLPEDLLVKILQKTPETAEKLSSMVATNIEDIQKARNILEGEDLIKQVSDTIYSTNLIAADGANIIEKMTGSDLLMSIAVGVEGLSDDPSFEWTKDGEQYYQWQDVLPHHVANTRLAQGIMFLMELSILVNADHDIRVMDGSHITSILKLNSLLTAKDDEFADEKYVESLAKFLNDNYKKIIPDIPDIIDEVFKDTKVIGLAKYSSSRDILDSYLKSLDILGDDKTYFSLVLGENEYTKPLQVGQSEKENVQWNSIHIKCNLDLGIDESNKKELNERLAESLKIFKPSESDGSDLFYCYYKPYESGLCYRLEMKKELANDTKQLHKCLNSIKKQIFFPDILEPYPQYLADLIAKNISFGMDALIQAIRSNEKLSEPKLFSQLLSYRSK